MKKRTLIVSLLLAALSAGFLFLQLLLGKGLPSIAGTLDLKELNSEVKITRSSEGFTHITAESDSDLFFAQGFAHAQDRMWQMELLRRTASGHLAEVTGPFALKQDKYFRTIDLVSLSKESWKNSNERTKKNYEAYSRGVNAWISQQKVLPPEFLILGKEISPWKPEDSVLILKTLSSTLGANSYIEIAKTFLVQKLGAEKAEELFPTYQKNSSRILNENEISRNLLTEKPYSEKKPHILEDLKYLEEVYKELSHKNLSRMAMAEEAIKESLSSKGLKPGSNNWVVSGKYTESGMPIMANDPHMASSIPVIFYLNELRGDILSTSGVTLPGIPGVVIGRNREIAWSVTTFPADVQDYYMEKIQDDNYLFKGEWHPLHVREEKIFVKGQKEPVTIYVKSTLHGPLMDEALEIPGLNLALKWTIHHTEDRTHEALMDTIYASDWNEFKKGMHKLTAPLLNFLYADNRGNIGYLALGKIPLRERGYGSVFVPGWTGEWEWKGFIPYEELPQSYNPSKGYIVTANNYNVPDTYTHFFGTTEAGFGYRAERVEALLQEKIKSRKPMNREDMAEIQRDEKSENLLRFAKEVQKITAQTEREKEVLALFKQWDGVTDKESVETTILHYWLFHLKDALDMDEYVQEEGEEYIKYYIYRLIHDRAERVSEYLQQGNETWFDDKRTAETENSETTLLRTLNLALDQLEKEHGNNRDKWQWGEIHKIMYSHPLFGFIPGIKNIFNREIPSGGSHDTVNMTVPVYRFNMKSSHIPTMRFIFDMADTDGNAIIIPTGQSGHVKSPYYDNLAELFHRGEYLDLSLSDREIRGSELILK